MMPEPDKFTARVDITWYITLHSYSPLEDVEAEIEDTVKSLLSEKRWGEITDEEIQIEVEMQR
jgi:hypothetical protein